MGDDRFEVGFGSELDFGRTDEAFKAAEAVEIVPVTYLRGVGRRLETLRLEFRALKVI